MRLIRLLVIVVFLSGCVPSQIIDEVQLIQALGFENTPNGKIRGTAAYPIFNADGSVIAENFSAEAMTSRFIRTKLNARSPKSLSTGQLRVVLFNTEFAEKGVLEIVNSLYRDPDVGDRLHMAVVDGSTRELLEGKYTTNPLPSNYVTDLLNQNIDNENMPRTNLHIFLYNYYGEGLDPYLPLIKKQGKNISIKGLALFKDDKYVGKLVSEDAFIFKLLVDGSQAGDYQVKIKKGNKTGYTVIRNIDGHSKYDLKQVNGVPSFTIHLNVAGEIHEYPPWINLEMMPDIKIVEKAFQNDIDSRAEKMIKMFLEKGIDPLGLGDQVRRKEKGWNEKEFNRQYQKMHVEIETKVKIAQSGVIE